MTNNRPPIKQRRDSEDTVEPQQGIKNASSVIEGAIAQNGTLAGVIEFMDGYYGIKCKQYFACPQADRRADTSGDILDPATAQQIVDSTNEVYTGILQEIENNPDTVFQLERLTQPASIFDASDIYEARLPILRALSTDFSETEEQVPTHFNIWILPNLGIADLIYLSMKKDIEDASIEVPGFSELKFFNAINPDFLEQIHNF